MMNRDTTPNHTINLYRGNDGVYDVLRQSPQDSCAEGWKDATRTLIRSVAAGCICLSLFVLFDPNARSGALVALVFSAVIWYLTGRARTGNAPIVYHPRRKRKIAAAKP